MDDAKQSRSEDRPSVQQKAVSSILKFTQKVSKRLSMDGILENAHCSLNMFTDPKYVKDSDLMPKHVIESCKGIVFMTVVKAGFLFTGETGTGCVLARNGEEWTGPLAIGTGGMSFGFAAGASKVDLILILNTEQALNAFTGNAQVRLGSELSVVAGPVGRQADVSVGIGKGSVDAAKKADLAPAFAYSHAKGLYGGIAFNGKVILKRPDCTNKFYGEKVDASDVLSGKKKPPKSGPLEALTAALTKWTTAPQKAQVQQPANRAAVSAALLREAQANETAAAKPQPVENVRLGDGLSPSHGAKPQPSDGNAFLTSD